jgi:hypothetical protein
MDTFGTSIINVTLIGSAMLFMLCMLYIGVYAVWEAYASGPTWRQIAYNLEKELGCLDRQNKALQIRVDRLKLEIEDHIERAKK